MAAKTVYKVEEIFLLDGETKVTLRPLSIKAQRGLANIVENAGENAVPDKLMTAGLEFISKMAVYCLQNMKETRDMNADELEDLLDQETALHVIKLCGGLDFSDDNPKLREAMDGA